MDSTNENMVPVFEVEDQAQEALVRSALEASGLHFMIVEKENLDWSQAEPFHHHSQVSVLEHEQDLAKSIIEEAIGGDA